MDQRDSRSNKVQRRKQWNSTQRGPRCTPFRKTTLLFLLVSELTLFGATHQHVNTMSVPYPRFYFISRNSDLTSFSSCQTYVHWGSEMLEISCIQETEHFQIHEPQGLQLQKEVHIPSLTGFLQGLTERKHIKCFAQCLALRGNCAISNPYVYTGGDREESRGFLGPVVKGLMPPSCGE